MSQLSQLRSPAAVQAAIDEFVQLGRTKFLARHGYGKSRDFLVRDPKTGTDCDSKAIAGVAFGKQFPEQGPLTADSFSGGEATVVPALTRLGFRIIRIGEDWSEEEVLATVEDYFDMLRAEAAGEPYNKSEHNQALRQLLNGRSKSSVELKHQNISAVLDALGLPYINGYKPRGNSQLLLRKSVHAYVLEHQQTVGALVDALEEVKLPGDKTYRAALVEPPAREVLVRTPASLRQRLPRKFDYAARDEANRKLGRAGEQWVIGYEQQRLTELGHPELFQRLDWVSDTQGDGAGFDILSFEEDAHERFIEVKTTNGGVGSSFLVSHNELEFSKEAGDQFGFADEFFHASEASARVDDLPVSISAVLMAEACNIGLEPLIRSNVPALTRHRLNWTKANYLRAETITSANARLVDFQATLPLAQIWGGGEVASADGMRFVTPVRTINAGPNRKYFGNNRGITWYNFVSDQYSGFHGIVIPGTLRDSIFVLEGLLEQETGLNPTEIMTDTAGASELVFGLFWLLGYQFSPRLADAGASVFWRMDHDADYGVLNDIARGQSDPRKIVLQWDEMIRTAGSLKLGKVQVSVLVRSLLKSERPSGLTQAIIEVGRINKTLYLLNYIDDEDYRRRILTQLNRGESRHAVARAICHGQKGEIRKRYTDGQEDQLGTLGLVTNAVVLWNTIYMQAALDHLRAQGETLNDEDIARLSPLCHGHINMLGHYGVPWAFLR
ncbi:hypothetical protein CI737_18700 [Escherichia coli]|nr:hypothetical protein CI737_18700 [Escherichia coli]